MPIALMLPSVDSSHQPLKSLWASQDTKSHFWVTYTQEAADHDGQILEKYNSDMDIVLIFAGLFSAVTTTFTVTMQSNLVPNPTTETNILLKKLIHTVDNSSFSGDNFDIQWSGPGSTQILVQSLMYASLSASLLAALGAMLGKQWLNHFQHVGHGTVDARGRQRQQKLDALYAWHFDAVLEGLPVLLQLSLLLFGVALGANLWAQQQIVACIVIGSTAFGVIFYALIVVAALTSNACPFQTPASNRLRWIGQHIVHLHNTLRKGNSNIPSALLRCVSYMPYITITLFNSFASYISLRLSSPHGNTDAPCIRWLLETSDDPDVIVSAASLVPEVEWPPDLDLSCVLLRLRDTFLDCFENTQYGQPKLTDLSRDRAIVCGKAFLHLYIERRSLDGRPVLLRDAPNTEFTLANSSHLHDVHWLMWTRHNDPELSFICDLILEIVLDVGVGISITLRTPNIPNAFLMWMSHPLLHCLSAPQYAMFWRRRALDAVQRLLASPLPPANVLANCLTAASLLLDQPIHPSQLTSTNKGSSVTTLLVSVLESMQQAIGVDTNLNLYERSSIYALNLLRPLAAVLEVEEFRQTAYDLGITDWGVRLCQSIVNVVLHHPELCRPEARDAAWVHARAALHFSVVASGNDDGLTDNRVTWKAEISRLRTSRTAGCGWLIDYITHHHSTSDQLALTDAFLTMSEMIIDDECREKMPAYIRAIVFAMAPDKLPLLREAAFRAAYGSRNYLASLDSDFLSQDLCTQFSVAISDTVADSVSFGQDDDGILSDNSGMCGEKNLRYLHILFSWTQSKLWSHHLHDDGHLEKCLSIANGLRYFEIHPITEHLALYTISIVARLYPDGEYNDLIPNDLCGLLVHKAWGFAALRSRKLPDFSKCVIQEVLEPFTSFTIQLLRCNAELVQVTAEFKSRVLQTLSHLEQGSADSGIISLVNEIVSLIAT
ncbi:hypothetical protein AZE42_02752 [Rhizopogon vesiculosus]|uniref:DUF6535 domain-containing protein n=1 Tax=Rhizopogon vesiculosus TaxID=180088 RepID=A0A1J8Q2E2_9AGAM|nr:hypothetical protein AZE42_02752 [Rhizopogon vesiculosus]